MTTAHTRWTRLVDTDDSRLLPLAARDRVAPLWFYRLCHLCIYLKRGNRIDTVPTQTRESYGDRLYPRTHVSTAQKTGHRSATPSLGIRHGQPLGQETGNQQSGGRFPYNDADISAYTRCGYGSTAYTAYWCAKGGLIRPDRVRSGQPQDRPNLQKLRCILGRVPPIHTQTDSNESPPTKGGGVWVWSGMCPVQGRAHGIEGEGVSLVGGQVVGW